MRVVGGAAIQNSTGEAIRSIRIVSNFGLWREMEKDGACAELVHSKPKQ